MKQTLQISTKKSYFLNHPFKETKVATIVKQLNNTSNEAKEAKRGLRGVLYSPVFLMLVSDS